MGFKIPIQKRTNISNLVIHSQPIGQAFSTMIQTHLIFDHSRPMDIDMAIICARVQAPTAGLSYRIINTFCIYQAVWWLCVSPQSAVLEDCLKVTLKCGQIFEWRFSETSDVDRNTIDYYSTNWYFLIKDISWLQKLRLKDHEVFETIGTSISRQIHHSQHR